MQPEQPLSTVRFSDLNTKKLNSATRQPLNEDICLEALHCTYGLKKEEGGGKKKED